MRERELEAVREIAHVYLTSATAVEVYRRALVRLTPMVGATFASVFLRDARQPELLKLECAQNWPQTSPRHLRELRFSELRLSGGKRADLKDVGREIDRLRPGETAWEIEGHRLLDLVD